MRPNHSHVSHQSRSHGFTIIELTLAMVFVSFILIFMALTLVQMLRIYDKSVSMKQVNQAGRTIAEDIGDAMRSESPAKVSIDHIGRGYLCVGPTVYVWNPLFTDGGVASTTLFTATPSTTNTPVTADGATMVRKVFSDRNTPCDDANVYSASPTTFQPGSEASLLSSRSRVVWATTNVVPAGVTASNQPKLVELTFTIGTYDHSEVDTPTKRGWLVSGDSGSYSNFAITPHRERSGATDAKITCLPGNDGRYCAFAEFKTVVYITGNQ